MLVAYAHNSGKPAAAMGRSRIALALVCVMVWIGVAAAQNSAATVADLARFATWPASAEHGLSLRICLRDDDPALPGFMALEDKIIGGRPVTVHTLMPDAMADSPCHIVYFSDGMADATIIAALRSEPVLTVSPQQGFAASGGMLQLAYDGPTLSIVVDPALVRDHPLRVSAQLLDLAKEVH